MMGRYSLDAPGLVYADSGNVGFDATKYATFPADADAIVPVMETDWFADDATNRVEEFIRKVWPAEGLEENLRYIAESLGVTRDEDARTTIRRYFATGFFKDHLKTYKKRPIYWLFSSGKQRAFQCLVYLHRYHEGTLARMRTEYVIPLQGKLTARIDALEKDIASATSTSHRKKLEKEHDTLKKQQTELHHFQEKLRHVADQRIALDLDDGVKVNYGKFGDLLAEVKTVTGGSDE
jgi:type II restriction/modification system DNA methylase subunit YeeA